MLSSLYTPNIQQFEGYAAIFVSLMMPPTPSTMSAPTQAEQSRKFCKNLILSILFKNNPIQPTQQAAIVNIFLML